MISSRRLPNGYDSPVGERGGHLSVGQRQRIGIARAFLKNAPILLLDEPTSALDPTTEAAIMETIKELMHGRTTLIVTHRLATIHNVDQIVVLEHGRIVESGRGAELVARGGPYAKLYACRQLSIPMSNVNSERRVEADWWADPDSLQRSLRRRILLRNRADFSVSSAAGTRTPSSSAIMSPVMPAARSRSVKMAAARSATLL